MIPNLIEAWRVILSLVDIRGGQGACDDKLNPIHTGTDIPASIGASWSGMQQQRDLHMGTTTMHVSAHVQVASCCCIALQLAPLDAGVRSP